MFASEMFHNAGDTDGVMDASSIFEQQGMIPLEQSSSPDLMRKDSLPTSLLPELSTSMPYEDDGEIHASKIRRQRDPTRIKDTKHSSKNEGTHTDRRYLCYLCNKLFTRRRSVRDHLVKIHAEKTWEPQRSLEVIVEPHSGEPIEPIEDIIARGVQTLPPKQGKVLKPKRESTLDEESAQMKLALEMEAEEESVNVTDLNRISSIAESALAEISPDLTQDSQALMDLDAKEAKERVCEADEARIETSTMTVGPTQAESRLSVEVSREEGSPSSNKKRPYPAPASKKGTAKLKTSIPSKRSKLSDSDRSTPVRSPSVTSAQRHFGSKLKQSVVPSLSPSSRASSRAASASPSPSAAASPASSNEDGEVFCTCRRGDNHSWMIACDGTCNDWYHGKCVGIKERDGDLIDKYICPMCTRDGFVTTWKRMCRRKDCRKPARVMDKPPSKYCSQDCALKFMTSLIARSDPTVKISRDGLRVLAETKQKRYRKKVCSDGRSHERRTQQQQQSQQQQQQQQQRSGTDTPAYSDAEDLQSEYETDTSADDIPLPTMGGSLRADEIKSLLTQCHSIENLRELGARPPTPPPNDDTGLHFDSYQQQRLSEMEAQITAVTTRLEIWSQREKFLDLIVARSKSITDSVKAGGNSKKKSCGYDPRCAWDESEFRMWLYEQSEAGHSALESGKIGPPPEPEEEKETTDYSMSIEDVAGKEEKEGAGNEEERKGGVCIKTNCAKHLNWQKAQIAEIRFEQDRLREKIGKLERERRMIRERAVVSGWEMKINTG